MPAGQPEQQARGLAQVILPGCLGIFKGLPDDVLKVRVHAGMRAQVVTKEKPRRSGAEIRVLISGSLVCCARYEHAKRLL